jgi:hypothetical protein
MRRDNGNDSLKTPPEINIEIKLKRYQRIISVFEEFKHKACGYVHRSVDHIRKNWSLPKDFVQAVQNHCIR